MIRPGKRIAAVKASATYPAPRAAAWAIHLAYPVALERTVATDMERTDLRMEAIEHPPCRVLVGTLSGPPPRSARRLVSISESRFVGSP